MRSQLRLWACLVGLLTLGRASAQEVWTQQASPTTQDLWSICSTAEESVAVGSGGAIVTSFDGMTWTAQTSGTTNWLVGVGYGNGMFVAVGDQGIILTSTDAVSWTTRVAGGGMRLNGVAYNGLIWLAVGEGGTVLRSTDGITWTASSVGTTHWLHAIVWDELRGQMWIAGEGGFMTTSKDGITFSPKVSGTTQDIESAACHYASPQNGDAFGGSGGYLAETNPNLVDFSVTVSTVPFPTHFYGMGVERLNADGSADASYAGLTLPYTGASSGVDWQVLATAFAADGSVYLDLEVNAAAAVTGPLPLIQGTYHRGIVRIDPNGNFDRSYALNFDRQVSNVPAGALVAPIAGLTFTSSGQGYLWGSFSALNGEARTGLARINPAVGANFPSLANLSSRADAGQGASALKVGFVTTGPAGKTMLLRGAGPSLAAFGVTGVLADPELVLDDASGNVQATNNNWQDGGQGPSIAAAGTAVGAFAFASGSLDSALLSVLAPGTHSFSVGGNGGGTGIALAEAYDADAVRPIFGGARAVNFSFEAPVGTGSSVVTAGFVIAGGNNKRVLIRAIGPALGSFGVAGFVPDPVLSLFSNQLMIAQQQSWNSQSELPNTFTDVGAFALPAGSPDSAVVLTLAPGDYSVQVDSVSGSSGITLVELYEVP